MFKPASICVLSAVSICFGALAAAHDAPSGWSYDATCCSSRDCRPIPSLAVRESPDGYLITLDNQMVPYADKRIKDSPDGRYHWCTVNGRDHSRTICLYVPPRSS